MTTIADSDVTVTVTGGVASNADPDELLAPLFASWRKPKLFQDAMEFLALNDLPICIVSDVDRDDLAAALGLHDLHFEHIVTSEDARAYKPRAEPSVSRLTNSGLMPLQRSTLATL